MLDQTVASRERRFGRRLNELHQTEFHRAWRAIEASAGHGPGQHGAMDDDAKSKLFRLVRLGKTKEVPLPRPRALPASPSSLIRLPCSPNTSGACMKARAHVCVRAPNHPTTHTQTHTNTPARTPARTHAHARTQVKEALATGALDVNDTDSKGDTLLHLAARNGHKAIVKEVRPRHAPAAAAECTCTS
jgi:hypothetical protein